MSGAVRPSILYRESNEASRLRLSARLPSMTLSPLILPPVITGFLYLLTGLFCVTRLSDRRANALPYLLWFFATVFWQWGWAVSLTLENAKTALAFIEWNYAGIVFIPITVYHFIVTFLRARDRGIVPYA